MQYFEEDGTHVIHNNRHSYYNFYVDRETGDAKIPFSDPRDDRDLVTKHVPKLSGDPKQIMKH